MSSQFLIEWLADLATESPMATDAVTDRHGFTSRESLVPRRWAKAAGPSGHISIRAPVAVINRFIEHCERERLSYGEAFAPAGREARAGVIYRHASYRTTDVSRCRRVRLHACGLQCLASLTIGDLAADFILEEDIGASLFERRARGVTLTSAGEIFVRYARDAMSEADRARSEISALQGLQRGTARVAAAEAFMTMVLPDGIVQFRNNYPGVNVVVQLATTNGVVASVREAQADFGIAYNPELAAEMEIVYSAPTHGRRDGARPSAGRAKIAQPRRPRRNPARPAADRLGHRRADLPDRA